MKNRIPKHTKIILKEMCKRVKAKYNKMKFDKPDWFMKYSWTESQQDDFALWMHDYLMNNPEARREIMAFPRKDKKQVTGTVRMFLLNYGFTQK